VIQPYLRDDDLIRDIDNATVHYNRIAVWWLGQSGYVIKGGGKIVYIDPYLSESLTEKYRHTNKPHIRMTANPLNPDIVHHADVVIASHKHSDHLDPATIPNMLRASPQARLVLPRALTTHVAAWGIEHSRLIPADADHPIEQSGLGLLPIPAAHERLDRDDVGNHLYLGYIIDMGGVRIYHSGDTIPYAGLIERLTARPIDVAFLPINGRDAARHAKGTPGNCTIEESLCIAALAGIKVLVPHHYDMFTFNTVPISAFVARAAECYPWQRVQVMECGRRYELP
jgi:L-ascorbate metabolism protein UlaG (beta-lactamase superfamily)